MLSIRKLGPALVAAVAICFAAAASAFATYDSEIKTTTLKGTQVAENVSTTNSGTWKCRSAEFTGTQTGNAVAGGYTAPELTLHPVYSKCTAFGGGVKVSTTGCNYKFTTAVKSQASLQIECEPGKEVVVNTFFGSCITRFPAQEVGGVVDFENQGAGKERDVLYTWTVSGIEYSQEGVTCTGGKGPFANGTLTGSVTLKGFEGAEQRGIWVT